MTKDLSYLHKLLEDALKGSEFAWWEWDIEKNRVTSNDLKAIMLGYDPAAFRGGGYQAYTELLHPDDYERTMQAMGDHLSGRAGIYQVDYRIRRADGWYTWYMDRGSIVERTPGGDPLKLRGIVVDLGSEIGERAGNAALVRLIRRSLPGSADSEALTVICSACKRLKISGSVYMPLDLSFEKVFSDRISHGICPECMERLYPEDADELDRVIRDALEGQP